MVRLLRQQAVEDIGDGDLQIIIEAAPKLGHDLCQLLHGHFRQHPVGDKGVNVVEDKVSVLIQVDLDGLALRVHDPVLTDAAFRVRGLFHGLVIPGRGGGEDLHHQIRRAVYAVPPDFVPVTDDHHIGDKPVLFRQKEIGSIGNYGAFLSIQVILKDVRNPECHPIVVKGGPGGHRHDFSADQLLPRLLLVCQIAVHSVHLPDFMIDRGFTYCIPPYMIRSNVVTGVMSFAEMDAMMYKIEGEDLYLIGTSEHSMIGKFIDTITEEKELPKTLTSYSPCFRKEKGAHGIEERGVYRIHQFEKQEMIVVCKPEESMEWFNKLWQNTVDLFCTLDIPVRTLECCSGDLADLKVKSIDVEAWSPRQQKYFEVGSCSNLSDAQARRLQIRIRKEDGSKYFAHTLNNTVVAPPRMLIAFLENNLQADGTVRIPKALRPYMGGKEKLIPEK